MIDVKPPARTRHPSHAPTSPSGASRPAVTMLGIILQAVVATVNQPARDYSTLSKTMIVDRVVHSTAIVATPSRAGSNP
ncbi:hypothetical protein ACFYVR_07740 [Rhodococcus sp. NPDC003318]|uniref:hypothetical protein n=1 Tax=Rhodococcus sp. NPDC003318 TaxID=3364503 RepID=UPI00367D5CFB